MNFKGFKYDNLISVITGGYTLSPMDKFNLMRPVSLEIECNALSDK